MLQPRQKSDCASLANSVIGKFARFPAVIENFFSHYRTSRGYNQFSSFKKEKLLRQTSHLEVHGAESIILT